MFHKLSPKSIAENAKVAVGKGSAKLSDVISNPGRSLRRLFSLKTVVWTLTIVTALIISAATIGVGWLCLAYGYLIAKALFGLGGMYYFVGVFYALLYWFCGAWWVGAGLWATGFVYGFGKAVVADLNARAKRSADRVTKTVKPEDMTPGARAAWMRERQVIDAVVVSG